jgi:uncharacterized protein (DUF1697 family)
MTTYIALLRGINVGGAKSVLMADLKKLFESMGFKKVQTYIQSGNVLFQSEKQGDEKLAAAIEKKIETKYGFHVPVVLRTLAEMEKILETNPYRKVKLAGLDRIYFTLLAEPPSKEALKNLVPNPKEKDEFKVVKKEVYLFCRGSYGTALYNNNWFEKKLGMEATTRNQETMEKLVSLGQAL